MKAACNSYVDTFESYTVLRDEVAKRAGGDLLQTLQKSDNGIMDMLDRRLMPEGMEWLVEAWPRFEDGELVKFGDMALIYGEVDMIEAVQLWIHGKPVIYGDCGSQQLERGERVKRPDSWERLEEDAGMQPHAYCVGHMLHGGEDEESTTPTNELFARDLVRRAKALAGVSER